MGEFAVVGWRHNSSSLVSGGWWQQCNSRSERQPTAVIMAVKNKKMKMKMVLSYASASVSTYSSTISTNIPLLESPAASFDRYLEDKQRVFKAIFPDTKRSKRLNQDEWRIHMLPVQFLYLNVTPVVDIRLTCKSGGRDYPDGVPPDITKVLELDILRWELQGGDDLIKPSEFSLNVNGAMYPDRQGKPSLKGQLQISMSFAVPPVLAVVPEDIRKGVAESLLQRLIENMKHKVNVGLIEDYTEFKRDLLMAAQVTSGSSTD